MISLETQAEVLVYPLDDPCHPATQQTLQPTALYQGVDACAFFRNAFGGPQGLFAVLLTLSGFGCLFHACLYAPENVGMHQKIDTVCQKHLVKTSIS